MARRDNCLLAVPTVCSVSGAEPGPSAASGVVDTAAGVAAASTGEVGRRPPRRRGYLVPGLIALIVCAGLAALIDVTVLQSHTPSRLVGSEVATQLAQAIQADRSEAQPPVIHCPPSEPLRAGRVFYCTLVRPGHNDAVIKVTEASTAGQFHFALPRRS